MLKSLQEKWK